MSEISEVQIEFIERRRRRPPTVDLLCDVKLQNQRQEARWFLLPATLDSFSGALGGAGINGVEVLEIRGEGRVVMGRFMGNVGFSALYVPGGAQVTLRGFTFSLWEEQILTSVNVQVVIATDFTVGGEPAHSWMDTDPMSDIGAEVRQEQAVGIGSREVPDLNALPVAIAGEHRIEIRVDLNENEAQGESE